MKRLILTVALAATLTTTSANAAHAWFFIPAIPTVISWVVPTSLSFKGITSYIGIKKGYTWVTHSSGKTIAKQGNKYVANTIK